LELLILVVERLLGIGLLKRSGLLGGVGLRVGSVLGTVRADQCAADTSSRADGSYGRECGCRYCS
jgi:hypothetical protein